MKINLNIVPWLIIGVLILILLIPKTCGEKKVDIEVTKKDTIVKSPEIKGEIKEPSNSDEIPVIQQDTVYIEGKTIYLQSPISEELKKELAETKDKYQTLLEANRKREYSQDFEDSLVSINVNSTVYGKLDKNEIKYTLKPRDIKLHTTTIEKTITKTDPFGILLIGGYNYSLDPSLKSNAEAGAGVRINKVSVIGTINTQKQAGGKIIIEL